MQVWGQQVLPPSPQVPEPPGQVTSPPTTFQPGFSFRQRSKQTSDHSSGTHGFRKGERLRERG